MQLREHASHSPGTCLHFTTAFPLSGAKTRPPGPEPHLFAFLQPLPLLVAECGSLCGSPCTLFQEAFLLCFRFHMC